MNYRIIAKNKKLKGSLSLTASKSESNRALIIQALCADPFVIKNLATAQDTVTLQKLLNSVEKELDVGAAGTTMRFLTAYLAARPGVEKTITGTERMQERPIGILVEALQKLGARIEYLKNPGFPPLLIKGQQLEEAEIRLSGSVSSQYITALLLIAPLLGLKLHLQGKVISVPYIEMTLKMLHYFGIESSWDQEKNIISVPRQSYWASDYQVEADWSSASYWYALAAFAEEVDLEINGLKQKSLQGDAVIANIMTNFGIMTSYTNDGIILRKEGAIAAEFNWDFTTCPDLAQTVAVVCAGLKVPAWLRGLETLKIKETDRIQALINELGKYHCQIESDHQTY